MNSVHDIPNTGIIAVFAFIFYLFIASFLGRYIPRLLVHLIITLQEEVWALGLSVLECFWSWCVSWSTAFPRGW